MEGSVVAVAVLVRPDTQEPADPAAGDLPPRPRAHLRPRPQDPAQPPVGPAQPGRALLHPGCEGGDGESGDRRARRGLWCDRASPVAAPSAVRRAGPGGVPRGATLDAEAGAVAPLARGESVRES
ncbi:hypothetical protein KPATCC21470_8549 [Kitasatospora purpeofusca]